MAGIKGLLALACAGVLSACASVLPPGMQARSACSDQPGGWCGFTRAMAVEAYEYAPLAQNAYKPDHETYAVLPDGITLRALVPNDQFGLAYAVFDRTRDGLLSEVIIAFRGTEFTKLTDWRFGNLGTTQRERGLQLYDATRAQLDDLGWRDVPITVTGHSLGGAIATHVSLQREGVKLRSFNTSPGFADMPDAPRGDRLVISESGEFLESLRNGKDFAGNDVFILDCNPRASRLLDHRMRRLGDCLIWIAAFESDAAHQLAEDNLVKPPAQNRYCDAEGRALPHPGPGGYGELRPQPCPSN